MSVAQILQLVFYGVVLYGMNDLSVKLEAIEEELYKLRHREEDADYEPPCRPGT